MSVVCCPNKPGLFAVGDERGGLDIVSNAADGCNFLSLCRLVPVNSVRISACTWSQDGKWIATGNVVGDIFLWDANVPTSVSFTMALPRTSNRSTGKRSPTNSVVFLPDSTALIFTSGGNLSVWDIENDEYVTNSGLPDKATNIALDGPRDRLAVVTQGAFSKVRITIYELKLREEIDELPEEMEGKIVIPPPAPQQHEAMCQMDGKSSTPPPQLREEMCQMDGKSSTPPLQPERRRRWFY